MSKARAVDVKAVTGAKAVAVSLAARGWGWADLATKCRISAQYLSNWRAGRRPGSLRLYTAIVRALPELEFDVLAGKLKFRKEEP